LKSGQVNRNFKLSLVFIAIVISLIACRDKERKDTQLVEFKDRYLYVCINDGVWNEMDATGMEPGADFLSVDDRWPFLWQAQDSISCRIADGLFYVNDSLYGVDLGVAETDLIPEDGNFKAAVGVCRKHLDKLKGFRGLVAIRGRDIADDDLIMLKDM
jgi:hypothetical protein